MKNPSILLGSLIALLIFYLYFDRESSKEHTKIAVEVSKPIYEKELSDYTEVFYKKTSPVRKSISTAEVENKKNVVPAKITDHESFFDNNKNVYKNQYFAAKILKTKEELEEYFKLLSNPKNKRDHRKNV